MNKKIITVLAILTIMSLGKGAIKAQVTVGSNTEPKATLEVVATATDSKPAGVIAPRMDRKYLNDNEAKYTVDLTGAIVYINDVSNGTATGQAVKVTVEGYYYFDGTLWQAFGGVPALSVAYKGDIHYTVQPTDDILLFTTAAATREITLPVSGVQVGKTIHLADNGYMGLTIINSQTAMYNPGNNQVYAGESKTLMYIGNGLWYNVTNY